MTASPSYYAPHGGHPPQTDLLIRPRNRYGSIHGDTPRCVARYRHFGTAGMGRYPIMDTEPTG